jgi:hypothetical protein
MSLGNRVLARFHGRMLWRISRFEKIALGKTWQAYKTTRLRHSSHGRTSGDNILEARTGPSRRRGRGAVAYAGRARRASWAADPCPLLPFCYPIRRDAIERLGLTMGQERRHQAFWHGQGDGQIGDIRRLSSNIIYVWRSSASLSSTNILPWFCRPQKSPINAVIRAQSSGLRRTGQPPNIYLSGRFSPNVRTARI